MEVLPDIKGTSGDTPTFVTFRLKVQNKSKLEPSTDLCHIAPPLPSITNLSAPDVQPPESVTLENSLARGGARQILHTNGTQSAGAKRRREDDDKENRDSDDDRTLKRPHSHESRRPSDTLPTIFDPLPNQGKHHRMISIRAMTNGYIARYEASNPSSRSYGDDVRARASSNLQQPIRRLAPDITCFARLASTGERFQFGGETAVTQGQEDEIQP